MICVLTHLEPRFEPRGTVLLEEMDEVCEVIFFTKGTVDIGYLMNYNTKYVVRQKESVIIGAYCCSFNKRAIFVYRCKTDCFGNFIRKEFWQEALNTEDGEFKHYLMNNVKHTFNQTKTRINIIKKQNIDHLKKRADLQQILVISNNYEQSCSDSEHDEGEEGNNHEDHCEISETCELEEIVEEYEAKID